ncbi:hypothetical protein P5G51_017775 [Virgibacillus sp. 179-BFC.A HS]|uniref:Uncharacterized protein n=1 Tax=Tigheibacillus jepli TaxID=3035914 RepID=A0ABU5CNB7_9BACI|nr:hypothetical protein [Virgibacillus sp. 179-BFC.A HS]MDY0406943.1 hypothetical protein [Virgibacillus sp. 179-BFC.A HS]
MSIFLGCLFIIWGVIIIFSSLIKLREKDYKDKGPLGGSGFIEWEFLFRILNGVPYWIVKGIVLFIGLLFIVFGVYIIR